MQDSLHLRGPDFEALMSGPEGGGYPHEAARAHLAQCEPCSRRMTDYRIQSARLRGVRAAQGARVGDACPDAEQLLNLAAGFLPEPELAVVMDHAATCDACGTLLKIAAEDLQSTEIPAEAAGAMSEQFRNRMASELRRQSMAGKAPTPFRAKRLLWAGAAIAAGIVLAVLAGRGIGTFAPKPEQLVARSYEAHRIWPMRFPGASYTPLAKSGEQAAPADRLLAEVDAAISKEFDAHHRDPRYVQLRSEVDFLRGSYEASIANLEPLAEGSYISAGIFIDLGIFHLARGMEKGEAADASKAVEYFSRALDAESRNAIALFNRALAFEALHQWDRAGREWKSYLEVDSASAWALEAREHLRQVTSKEKPAAN